MFHKNGQPSCQSLREEDAGPILSVKPTRGLLLPSLSATPLGLPPITGQTIRADGEAIEMTAVVVLVVNAGMLGAAPFRFAPNIAIDDGWLDIVIYRPRTMAQRAGVLWRIFRQRADGSNMVQRKARSVEIKAPDVQWYEVDGEVHRGNVLRAEIVPGGVRVVA